MISAITKRILKVHSIQFGNFTRAICAIKNFFPDFTSKQITRVLRVSPFSNSLPESKNRLPGFRSERKSPSGLSTFRSYLLISFIKKRSAEELAFGLRICCLSGIKMSIGKISSFRIGKSNCWKVAFHSAPCGLIERLNFKKAWWWATS